MKMWGVVETLVERKFNLIHYFKISFHNYTLHLRIYIYLSLHHSNPSPLKFKSFSLDIPFPYVHRTGGSKEGTIYKITVFIICRPDQNRHLWKLQSVKSTKSNVYSFDSGRSNLLNDTGGFGE